MRNFFLITSVLLVTMNETAWTKQECDLKKPEIMATSRFSINKTTGKVFDNMTQLIWKICPEGTIYSNEKCYGDMTFTWIQASKLFNSNADYWRLPSTDELKTIIERRCINPATNLEVFPNTQPSIFWASNFDSSDQDYANNIYFGRGLIGNDLKTKSFYVRLVTGRPWVGNPPLLQGPQK